MTIFGLARAFIRLILKDRAHLAAENLALRQQLAVAQQGGRRPKFRRRDKIFWVWLSQLWTKWRTVLTIVKPETVVRWHQQGFKLYWTWKSKRSRPPGRPKIDPEIRDLIGTMSRDNPTWGVRRIRDELALLGHLVSLATVWKYADRSRKPPSQTWRTFLENHALDIVAIDFFTVPTAMFSILYCFVVLEHSRRRLLHFNVTKNPTAEWTALQIVQAFPYDTAPRFILRDNDGTYGDYFSRRVEAMGIEKVKIAPYSPWQNPFAERVTGSARRDCLDHLIILNERHLLRILKEYAIYYNEFRPHQSLEGNSPLPREVQNPDEDKVIAIPILGGLHHRYERAA